MSAIQFRDCLLSLTVSAAQAVKPKAIRPLFLTLALAALVSFAPQKTLSGWLALATTSLQNISDPWRPEPAASPSFDKLAPRLAYTISRDSLDLLAPLIGPISAALQPLNKNAHLRYLVARSIAHESIRQGVAPALILGIMSVENTTLNPKARSSAGATGLMQVMPFHAGRQGCKSSDLIAVDSNICHGVKVLRYSLKAKKGNLHKALLAYNGCVKGTTTPNCHTYPAKVLQAAARAQSRMDATETPLLALGVYSVKTN